MTNCTIAKMRLWIDYKKLSATDAYRVMSQTLEYQALSATITEFNKVKCKIEDVSTSSFTAPPPVDLCKSLVAQGKQQFVALQQTVAWAALALTPQYAKLTSDVQAASEAGCINLGDFPIGPSTGSGAGSGAGSGSGSGT